MQLHISPLKNVIPLYNKVANVKISRCKCIKYRIKTNCKKKENKKKKNFPHTPI